MTVNIRFTASVPALIFAGVIVGFVAGAVAYRTAQDVTRSSDQKAMASSPASSATAVQCSRIHGDFRPVIAAIVAKPASIASP